MTKEELIDKTNEAIAELVYDKFELLKAYNYYNGKRDPELYRYLEENYGIGSPTAVGFTPLLKKHVDALVGEFLGTPLLPKISCKDSETISAITREKSLEIDARIVKFLKAHLRNSILLFIDGKDITDKAIEKQLDKIVEDVNLSFVSQYEVAALNIILYILLSREADVTTKLRLIFTDLLVTGYTFFRAKESFSKTNVKIEVLNPLNTFIELNPESPYVKHSPRAVVRYWLTKAEIIAKYGKEMRREDLKTLKDEWYNDGTAIYRRTFGNECTVVDEDLEAQTIPGYPDLENGTLRYRLIPVYDVEWLETDDNFVMHRYNTIRIGEDIHILRGEDKNAIRTKDNPNLCTLSINGVYFLNRDSRPYSLILHCVEQQDRYDLLHYYKDCLIANSGTAGVIMDMSLLPKNLGVDWPEQVLKWLAYKKAGIEWVDTSQEGRNDNGNAPLNTIFNGFDDTLKLAAILAVETAIEGVEKEVSSITGVFRERLNGIELHDAVTNVKQGVTNSFTVTKHYFHQMDLIVCELLLDCLNQAKRVYKNGLTGTLILGDKYLKVFTALPEHFTFTDYDIHIVSSTEVMLDLQSLKAIIPDLIKSLLLSPDIIFEALTSKSLSDLKYKVQKALQKQKEENNLIQLLSLKLEEAQQQMQLLQSELQKAQAKVQQLDESRLKLETDKIQLQYQVDWYKAQTDRTFKERQMDIEDQRTKIELAQLHDGNPYNDKVKLL